MKAETRGYVPQKTLCQLSQASWDFCIHETQQINVFIYILIFLNNMYFNPCVLNVGVCLVQCDAQN
jgi:hypothetical protein